jgi:hypothetical protein
MEGALTGLMFVLMVTPLFQCPTDRTQVPQTHRDAAGLKHKLFDLLTKVSQAPDGDRFSS